MQKFLFTFLFLILVSQFSFSQDLDGKWSGYLTQYPAVLTSDYYFEMELEVNQKEVTGHSYIYIDENFGKMSLKGKIKGKKVEFYEQKIVDASIEEGYLWCIKEGTLTYSEKGGIASLDGIWEGFTVNGACNPGDIHLEKKLPNYKNPIDDIEHSTFVENGVIKKVAGREAKKGQEIIVNSTEVKIKISDNQHIDNDIVTVYFNGEKVLDSCSLKRQPTVIKLTIDPEAPLNFISFHAITLGEIPPNTASLRIDDGIKERYAKVESDLNRSDIIYLKYKAPK